MKNNLIGCLSAAVLGAAIALSTPAMAFRGGGGFGGMHGGFGGGGMHFGGGGFGGGGMRFSGGGFAGSGFRRGLVTGRSVFVPGGNRFAAAPFAGQRFAGSRFNHFAFRNRFFAGRHRFRNFAFFGAPFAVGRGWPCDYDYAAYSGCWRQAWTSYGWQWVNVCNDYDNYGY